MNIRGKFFKDDSELKAYIDDTSNLDVKKQICYGVTFDKIEKNKISYRMRFNGTGGTYNIPDTNKPLIDISKKEDVQEFDKFIKSGFFELQNLVDNIILRNLTNSTDRSIKASLQPQKTPDYSYDSFSEVQVDTFILYPMLLPFIGLLFKLLYEKERKIKESLKMMGMKSHQYYLSWFITYCLIMFIVSFLLAIVYSSMILKTCGFFLIFCWFFLLGLNLISLSFFASAFYTSAKKGILFGIILFVLMMFMKNVVSSKTLVPKSSLNGISLLPLTAFSLGGDVMVYFESNDYGISFSNAGTEHKNYSMATSLGFLLLDFFIFSILAIYFDLVFPNEFGQKKHPLFFIKCLFPKKSSQESDLQMEMIEGSSIEEILTEPVSEALLEQERQNKILEIRNLYKHFDNGSKIAVNNLSLKMYNGQIFALLGHNGAGKTTTMSIINGLLDPSSGSIKAYGIDVIEDMDEFRKVLGVCPQHDVLYDDLTVKEHLEIFANLKGVPKNEIESEITKMIADLDLTAKTHAPSKTLSGGQKRRLSVGIAFLGNSKVIILDEPTAGMDTSARRHVWEILKRFRTDRIIILTTHFMDEADFLGDRIGIMSAGAMKCCGSSIFLKNNYGVGYNLKIVKEFPGSNEEIIDLVKSSVKSTKVLSQVSSELTLQLPLEEASNFEDLLNAIEARKHDLNIDSYGISITTLEEVFLKVGENNETPNKGSKFDKRESVRHMSIPISGKHLESEYRINDTKKLFFIHLKGILLKRLIILKRDWRGILCEIFLPILIVAFALALTLITYKSAFPSKALTISSYNRPQKMYFGGVQSKTVDQFKPIVTTFPKSDFEVESKDVSRTQMDQIMFKDRSYDRLSSLNIDFEESFAETKYEYTFIVNSVAPSAGPTFINYLNKAIIQKETGNKDFELEVWNHPLPFDPEYKSVQRDVQGFLFSIAASFGSAFIPVSLIVFIVKEREINSKHLQMISGVSKSAYWIGNFMIDYFKLLIPTIVIALLPAMYGFDWIKQSDSQSALIVLMIMYGPALLLQTYFMSFLFKSYTTAQVVTFVVSFLIGVILSMAMYFLRMLDATKDAATAMAYIFRVIPSFSLAFGLISIALKESLQFWYGWGKISAFNTSIMGSELIYLGIMMIVLVILIYIAENIGSMPKFFHFFSKEFKTPYLPTTYEDDVERENFKASKAFPKEYAVLAKSLRKVYPNGKVAVNNISLAIPQGECFGLLGINGAGKTTTFKILSCDHQPTSGEAYINGYNVNSELDMARKYIGYCPQFDALTENFSVIEHLRFYASIKGFVGEVLDKVVEDKLKELDFENFRNSMANRLSGGNKRKLSVGIALLGGPPIIFLDEPSTGMDPAAKRFMWNVISAISITEKESAVILTTHSMEEAEALSTRMGIMVDGQLQCIGSIQHIKNKYGQGYEIEVMQENPSAVEINQVSDELGIKGKELTIYETQLILKDSKYFNLIDEISDTGLGSHIKREFSTNGKVNFALLAEFIIAEGLYVVIQEFFLDKFGPFSIIEHFGSFYRFKVESNAKPAKIFGILESHKSKLAISQYSVSQATLEQIFNLFATNKIENLQHRVSELNTEEVKMARSSILAGEGRIGSIN